MSDYRVKAGYGQSLVSLTVLDPQPFCLGLQFTEAIMLADRSTHLEGAFFTFDYSVVIDDETGLAALYTLHNFGSAMEAEVTVYGPNINYGMTRYNAIAHKPIPGQSIGRSNFFIRGAGILYTDLVAL